VQHLGMLKTVVSKHLGEQVLLGQPITLTRTPSNIARAAPKRGEHGREVLEEIGYTPEKLAELKAAGVI